MGTNLLYEKLSNGSDNVVLQHIHPVLLNDLYKNEVSASDILGADYIFQHFPKKKVTYIVDDMQGHKFDFYNKDGVTRHVKKRK